MKTCIKLDYGNDEIFTYEIISKNEIRELDFLFDGKNIIFQKNEKNPILKVFRNAIGELVCENFTSRQKIQLSSKKIVNVQTYGKKFVKNQWFNSANYKIED